uniref:Pleckstrin homology domain-containing family J member 1 n=1 Tax=Clastoptera arizonana TaxID=38151 RepID=A0A1B6D669_9HEMI
MRFNDKELAEMSLGEGELEGRLNYRKHPNGNFNQNGGFKERWFKLKCNLLFYFKISDQGKMEKQPAGVFVLENAHVQKELSTAMPFAFSLTFSDDPDKKHMFSARTEELVLLWVSSIKKASYEYWRSQMIILQTKISLRTGKDPLLMYPRNEGSVRDVQSSRKIVKSTFQSHIQTFSECTTSVVREAKLIDL